MSSQLRPVAFWGLKVPPSDDPTPVISKLPGVGIFHITMAAIDPTAKPVDDDKPKRATLKLLRRPLNIDDYNDLDSDDGSTSSSDSEVNDNTLLAKPTKAPIAAAKKGEKDDIVGYGKNSKKNHDDDKEKEGNSDDEAEFETEEFIICTLDAETNCQQVLNIIIGEDEEAFFKVAGNYNISLSGNYLIDETNPEGDSDDESDYDLSPDEDELIGLMGRHDSEDELDDVENPRITEASSDDEGEPEERYKGKGHKKEEKSKLPEKTEEPSHDKRKSLKRPAEEDEEKKEEPKLSKKQLKKLKANDGKQIPITTDSPQSKKKVQFAKELEQGQSPKNQNQSTEKPSSKRVIQGVIIEDKKLGKGPVAKDNSKLSLRYIGKLTDGKVFDSNTKGKPFSFCLGNDEVIKGWDIGVSGMQVGGERRITIPPHLGYGKKGTPGIPSNSTLVFDVKLLGVK